MNRHSSSGFPKGLQATCDFGRGERAGEEEEQDRKEEEAYPDLDELELDELELDDLEVESLEEHLDEAGESDDDELDVDDSLVGLGDFPFSITF